MTQNFITLQILEDLLQRARNERSSSLATMGVAATLRDSMSGSFSTSPSIGSQERAGAPIGEHQDRPDFCTSSRKYKFLSQTQLETNRYETLPNDSS